MPLNHHFFSKRGAFFLKKTCKISPPQLPKLSGILISLLIHLQYIASCQSYAKGLGIAHIVPSQVLRPILGQHVVQLPYYIYTTYHRHNPPRFRDRQKIRKCYFFYVNLTYRFWHVLLLRFPTLDLNRGSSIANGTS